MMSECPACGFTPKEEITWVDNTIFRERFEELEELTIYNLGRRIDVDGWSLSRMLGLRLSKSGGKFPCSNYQTRIRYEYAVRLCNALDIDYREAGV
jgi:hypothetical protein